MYANSVVCRSCGEVYPIGDYYRCPKCGGIMEIKYDDSKLLRRENILSPEPELSGMWKYHHMLPVRHAENIVSLCEGDTPLIKADASAAAFGMNCRLYIKAEMFNPSGSFKDRPSSVGVSVAKEHGHRAVIVASSGNASAAVSCYAARAGIPCAVLIPASTDPGKVAQALAYGAKVFSVRGTFSDAFNLSVEISEHFQLPNITSTFYNPYTVEGDKTIAYELYSQLGHVPDYIVVPIGTGPLLVGVYKGFCELMRMGLIDSMPRMIGVQSSNCCPIVDAFEQGLDRVEPWLGECKTVAGGIADPLVGYEADGELTLSVVRQSGGAFVAVSDAEVLAATAVIQEREGIYCEPTGATTLCGAHKLFASGVIRTDSSVVLLCTGHGFKYSGHADPSNKIIDYSSTGQVAEILSIK